MNCGGTSITWSNCSWAARRDVKAKNSAPAHARNGCQRPKIMIASAVKPRWALMPRSNVPTASRLRKAPPSPASPPASAVLT